MSNQSIIIFNNLRMKYVELLVRYGSTYPRVFYLITATNKLLGPLITTLSITTTGHPRTVYIHTTLLPRLYTVLNPLIHLIHFNNRHNGLYKTKQSPKSLLSAKY